MADGHHYTDKAIAEALFTSTSTVFRTRRAFVSESMETAISGKPRRGGLRKPDANQEAFLVATACSNPPAGAAK